MRNRARVVIAGIALVALVAGLIRAVDTLGIAVAYKAKMLCSGVFVSGRAEKDVLAELELDDLAPLRFIRATLEPSEGQVTASALGVVRRQAASRGATGCALVPGGMTRTEFRQASRRDPVELWQRKPGRPLEEAPPDDSVRIALEPVLDRAFAENDTGPQRHTKAVVVLHNGRIVAERYAPGIRAETPLLGWSMAKSVTNALIGILVRERRLQLDAPAPIPAWRDPGDPRNSITVNHMLQMSTGLRFDEGMTSLRSDVIRMLLASDDMASFAMARDLEALPGTRWEYASGTTVLLALVIRNVIDDDSAYVTFPREALFDRIGMHSAVMETDATGTFVGSSLMYATARDWARFGQLYLNDGVWDGRRILPEGWVEYSRTPAAADPSRRYGAHFWLGVPSGADAPVSSLPAGSLQAAGHEGQFVTIVPSHQAVIVRLGRTRYSSTWDQLAFVRAVLDGLPTPPPRVSGR